jgi:chromosome segregation ATPase
VYLEPAELADLVQRAERAESALAHIADAHGAETTNVEAMLRERAGVIAAMQKELDRREHLVHELVAALEEARASTGAPLEFEAAPAMPGVAPEEVARLRRKMDELALEVARREAELAAQAWRITELENDKRRLAAKVAAPAPVAAPPRALDRDLAAARDELDALRQALTQEHAARLAAESGEELTRARAELARQSALLEQMRGRGAQPEG